MARAGIYKSEVVRARDRLVAQGRYPSIDAVRVELGNTGSKATIHRYLKEIDEEEGDDGSRKAVLSEALQELVARLAGRLQDEADAKFAESQQALETARHQYESQLAMSRQEATALRQQLERTEVGAGDLQRELAEVRRHAETDRVRCSQLEQQVIDLQERLATEAQHRHSLDEKHGQAREALDHFRNAAKEQREQTQRQHDQQLQYLQSELRTLNQTLASKHEELTLSHRDNSRLTAEGSRLQTELQQAQRETRVLKRAQEQLAASERQVHELQQRLESHHTIHAQLTVQHEELMQRMHELELRLQQREIELASAQAASLTQAHLLDGFKKHLGGLNPNAVDATA